MRRVITPLLLLALWQNPALAADLLKEAEWARAISATLAPDQVVYLQSEGQQYLAIMQKTNPAEAQGLAILLHGYNSNADESNVIRPLRTALHQAHWHALSLQLPVSPGAGSDLDKYNLVQEAVSRIRAAVEKFREMAPGKVVLIGHDLGAAMALRYLLSQEGAQNAIQALVLISVDGGQTIMDEGITVNQSLKDIRIPILDVLGSQDNAQVLNQAPLRSVPSGASASRDYQQLTLPGANHDYDHTIALLSSRVVSWLKMQP